MGALSMGNFVTKTAVNPMRVLDLFVRRRKLGIEADGDVTVTNLMRPTSIASYASSKPILAGEKVIG
jgi:formylmethanofuran dehydrogenase subunit A